MTGKKPDDDALRRKLTDEQFRVTQQQGTERAFTGRFVDHKAEGSYHCVARLQRQKVAADRAKPCDKGRLMKYRLFVPFVAALSLLGACTKDAEPTDESAAEEPAVDVATVAASGLGIRKIRNGYGRPAQPGDFVTVHYTGWLYDEAAPDNRGEKFDSSLDRDQKFQFTLGESRVIDGWHRGVEGMLIGETRELTIPPEMGYGDRGAGGGVIPPGATLVFEIELFSAESPDSG